MNHKLDYIWHRWINEQANPQRGDWNGPCMECGKLLDQHGKQVRLGRLCPLDSLDETKCFTPKPFTPDKHHPLIGTMYAFKSAIEFMPWAALSIKKVREGTLTKVHQQCSHCKPEPIEDNVMQCWLGEDVAKCPILNSLQELADTERSRNLPDGRKSYYADVTQDEIYTLMGYVCTWHLLMSHLATEKDELPPGTYVDWNEGAFQDKSDRIFWERVYDSMSTPSGHTDDAEDQEQDDEKSQ